jgi:hypothetical protein
MKMPPTPAENKTFKAQHGPGPFSRLAVRQEETSTSSLMRTKIGTGFVAWAKVLRRNLRS